MHPPDPHGTPASWMMISSLLTTTAGGVGAVVTGGVVVPVFVVAPVAAIPFVIVPSSNPGIAQSFVDTLSSTRVRTCISDDIFIRTRL